MTPAQKKDLVEYINQDKSKVYLVALTQDNGEFYTSKTFSGKYGTNMFNKIKDILLTPDPPEPPPNEDLSNVRPAPQESNVVITPEDTIVDEINKSTNKDQAKLSIMQSPIKDLVAIGIRENEINTVRKVWDEQTKAAVRIAVKIDGLKDENKTSQDEVNKLELDKLNGDNSSKTENRIKELEQEIERNKVIIEQEKTN